MVMVWREGLLSRLKAFGKVELSMRITSGLLLNAAGICMLVALALQNVSIASNDTRAYRGVLITALALTTIADVCCAIVAYRGGWQRWLALMIALPTLYIIADFLRRAPYVFGQ